MRYLPILVLTLALQACSNTVASLHYVPTTPVQAVSVPSIGAVTATDQRKEAPTRLATILGGFGNPLKTLDTAKPVKDEVADAFLEGLCVRVLDQAGRIVFQDSAIDSESDLKFFQTGILADIDDLQVLSQTVLNRTVDRMLDNPAFRAAVANAGR